MKNFPAILAAFLITLVVGISMLAIGGNALFNPNSGPVSNTPQQAQSASMVNAAEVQVTGSNQALIQQYQQREKQYQAQLQEATRRLAQANQQLQKKNDQIQQQNQEMAFYTQLVEELQQRGIIRISQDGQVFVPRGDFHDDD